MKKKSTLKGSHPRKTVKPRTYTVDLSGIPVKVTRKEIKSLRLRVSRADLSVHLSVPLGASEQRAMLFLSSREPWLRETLERLKELPGGDGQKHENGDSLDLWGVRYYLEVAESGSRYSLTLPDEAGGTAIFKVPFGSTPEKRERFLREFYKKELSAYLCEVFPKWESITGLSSASRDIRYMKSRWGSCNTKTRHIRMNLRLAQHPQICTEYVVLHELCHIKEPNHGKAFKALLDAYMPEWKAVRKLLNGR